MGSLEDRSCVGGSETTSRDRYEDGITARMGIASQPVRWDLEVMALRSVRDPNDPTR